MVHDQNDRLPENVRQPLTDSPWFWINLFATAGLIALFIMGPRYNVRQAEIEREFSARQSHGHTVKAEDGPIQPPEQGRQNLTLMPFYLICGVIWAASWSMLWAKRFRTSRSQTVHGNSS